MLRRALSRRASANDPPLYSDHQACLSAFPALDCPLAPAVALRQHSAIGGAANACVLRSEPRLDGSASQLPPLALTHGPPHAPQAHSSAGAFVTPSQRLVESLTEDLLRARAKIERLEQVRRSAAALLVCSPTPLWREWWEAAAPTWLPHGCRIMRQWLFAAVGRAALYIWQRRSSLACCPSRC